MTAEVQQIQWLKSDYPKERVENWLLTNRFPLHDIGSEGKYYTYNIRPKSSYRANSFYVKPVGNMRFIYGYTNFRTGRKQGKKKQNRDEPLADAIKKAIEPEPIGGSVQSVRIPKDWGIDKARQWVDNKGWTPDYYGKSPFTETDKWYRFRQHAPHKGDDFKIKSLPNKVQLVMEYT